MESGTHRISFKVMEEGPVYHVFGLVPSDVRSIGVGVDGVDQSIWAMNDSGFLLGNGEDGSASAEDNDMYHKIVAKGEEIEQGKIVSMEADLDRGTLRFWVDGKQHCCSYEGGVLGCLRWAVSLEYWSDTYTDGWGVQIVPTPELECWTWTDTCRYHKS
jgi:hypothetical protein